MVFYVPHVHAVQVVQFVGAQVAAIITFNQVAVGAVGREAHRQAPVYLSGNLAGFFMWGGLPV
jgi:hypothetical protein